MSVFNPGAYIKLLSHTFLQCATWTEQTAVIVVSHSHFPTTCYSWTLNFYLSEPKSTYSSVLFCLTNAPKIKQAYNWFNVLEEKEQHQI